MKDPQTDEELNFCKKWNIRYPVNPTLHYKEYIHKGEEGYEKIRKYIQKKYGETGSDSSSYSPVHGMFGAHHLLSKIFLPKQFSQMPLTPIDTYTYEIEGGTNIDLSDKILRDGLLKIQVNLNYSKNRLLKEFKRMISEWKQIYEDAYRNNLYSEMHDENLNEASKIADKKERARQSVICNKKFEKVYRQKLNSRKKMYEPKYHFDNFDIYLQVYDLKKEGKSWSEITSNLNLNSIQTARNNFNAADKIINEGIDLYVK